MMNTPSESELLQGARAYNQEALAAIYDRYSPGLYAYAVRLLGDACLAEECVGETFSRFLKGLRAGNAPDTHLQAYLYRVAHNWITDFYRREPRAALGLDDEWPCEDTARTEVQAERRIEREAARREVRAALSALTPDQRQVIVLRFLEGWDNEQVAESVGKPVGAVKALQHRAIATLRRWLQKDREGETHDHILESGNG
jgi:RNA polymerase sigma-70 factor (ECF subfamily)